MWSYSFSRLFHVIFPGCYLIIFLYFTAIIVPDLHDSSEWTKGTGRKFTKFGRLIVRFDLIKKDCKRSTYSILRTPKNNARIRIRTVNKQPPNA